MDFENGSQKSAAVSPRSITSSQHEKMVMQSQQVLKSTLVATNGGKTDFHPVNRSQEDQFRATMMTNNNASLKASVINQGRVPEQNQTFANGFGPQESGGDTQDLNDPFVDKNHTAQHRNTVMPVSNNNMMDESSEIKSESHTA